MTTTSPSASILSTEAPQNTKSNAQAAAMPAKMSQPPPSQSSQSSQKTNSFQKHMASATKQHQNLKADSGNKKKGNSSTHAGHLKTGEKSSKGGNGLPIVGLILPLHVKITLPKKSISTADSGVPTTAKGSSLLSTQASDSAYKQNTTSKTIPKKNAVIEKFHFNFSLQSIKNKNENNQNINGLNRNKLLNQESISASSRHTPSSGLSFLNMLHSQSSMNVLRNSPLGSEQLMSNQTLTGENLSNQVQMMINNKMNVAQIQLSPPHLGNMQIQITSNAHRTDVTLTVHNAAAQDALKNHLPFLHEMLSQSGQQVQVQIQYHPGGQEQRQFSGNQNAPHRDSSSFRAQSSNGSGTGQEEDLGRVNQRVWIQLPSGKVDHYI